MANDSTVDSNLRRLSDADLGSTFDVLSDNLPTIVTPTREQVLLLLSTIETFCLVDSPACLASTLGDSGSSRFSSISSMIATSFGWRAPMRAGSDMRWFSL